MTALYMSDEHAGIKLDRGLGTFARALDLYPYARRARADRVLDGDRRCAVRADVHAGVSGARVSRPTWLRGRPRHLDQPDIEVRARFAAVKELYVRDYSAPVGVNEGFS
jgi:hypothetical protein